MTKYTELKYSMFSEAGNKAVGRMLEVIDDFMLSNSSRLLGFQPSGEILQRLWKREKSVVSAVFPEVEDTAVREHLWHHFKIMVQKHEHMSYINLDKFEI